jgi:DNA-damage-inducible protein J
MANGKSNINVKIDANVKELAIQLLGRMGLDQTTAIDMFYRRIIMERRLPFQPAVISTLDDRLMAALEKTPAKEYALDVDANGSLVIDKEAHPELYDWAVNG